MNLHEKLLEIRKAVPYLQKVANNQQQGFKYTGSSQVLGAVRAKMDELGVLLISAVTGSTFHPKGNGNKMNTTEIVMHMQWVNVEDPSDKIMVPYYFIRFFLISAP